MSPENTHAPSVHFPNDAHPDVAAAECRLALLRNWCSGSAATAIAMGGLLPFAVAWHLRYLAAVAASIIFAAILAVGTHVARRQRLATLALSPELVQMEEVAAERRRLQSARTRRTLAAALRRTADPIQSAGRFDPCPVLVDRVAPIRDEILKIANDLEQTQTPDPACIALIRELLTNGSSPLYNPNLPADSLYTNVARARAGIAGQTLADAPRRQRTTASGKQARDVPHSASLGIDRRAPTRGRLPERQNATGSRTQRCPTAPQLTNKMPTRLEIDEDGGDARWE
jgi:hypothetical protein